MKRFTCAIMALAFLALSCSGRFVKRDELKFLHEKYQGDYKVIKKIDIGNNQPEMKPGTRVKIYFKADGDSVKVYAYKHNQPREQAIGKNILYLFESDFGEDEEYKRELFLAKLDELIAPVN